MNELISVIVPIYNVGDYLAQCVECLINQSYKNLEIILVDDGSTDECPEICDNLAKTDTRIKVIHKKNGGLSDARNAGYLESTGEYISFIDSDDLLSTEMLSTLKGIIDSEGSEIAECEFTVIHDRKIPEESNEAPSIVKSCTAEEALGLSIYDKIFRQTVWNKLYKRNVIGDILFAVGKIHEDEHWTYRILANCKKLSHTDKRLYFYYQRQESIMNTKFSLKRLSALEGKKERIKFFKINYPSLVFDAKRILLLNCLYLYQLALKALSGDELNEARLACDSTLRSLAFTKEEKHRLSSTDRFWLILSGLSFPFACRLRNLLKKGM